MSAATLKCEPKKNLAADVPITKIHTEREFKRRKAM
jgi:hypothetical protein